MKSQNNQLPSEAEVQKEDKEASVSTANLVLRPNVNSTATISSFQPLVPHSDLPAMLDELDAQTSAIWSGNLNRPEEMLTAQAHALDAIFNTLAQKASKTMSAGHVPSTEAYLRMALKAQSQCRTTLETLAEIKVPKSATFIRQTNIAEQQQVNNGTTLNGTTGHTRTHEKNTQDFSNKLLEVQHGERMDSRTASKTISNDSNLEAMEKILRPKNRGWEG